MDKTMKPIARVHWVDYRGEQSRDVYTQTSLNRLAASLKARNVVSWICMCDVSASAPKNYRGA